jgi:hypothetical protein
MRGTMTDAILKQLRVGGVPDAAAVCLLHTQRLQLPDSCAGWAAGSSGDMAVAAARLVLG